MLKNIIIALGIIVVLFLVGYNYIVPTFFARYFETKYPEIRGYNSDYTTEEIKFGNENVFPNAISPENMIKIFAESLQKKDKITIKLLSTPEFRTISPKMWNEQFDKFWDKYQGKEISYSQIKYNTEGGCEKGFEISTKDKTIENKFVCVYKSYYGWENKDRILNESKSYYTLSLVW